MLMEFVFPDGLAIVIRELIIKMYENNVDFIEIPNSNGQILMKSDSTVASEKFEDESVSMFPLFVPVKNQTSISFYICCPR